MSEPAQEATTLAPDYKLLYESTLIEVSDLRRSISILEGMVSELNNRSLSLDYQVRRLQPNGPKPK